MKSLILPQAALDVRLPHELGPTRTASLILILALALAAVPAHAQQQTRTTCYDSGKTRICDTVDNMGNPVSKSRCYQSGRDTRCDTKTFGGASTTPLIPNGGRPQR
jgi:hypothetical protein